MNRAHGVQVSHAGRALKHGVPKANLDQSEVQCFGHERVGHLATRHGLHELQPGHAGRLVCAGNSRAGTGIHHSAQRLLLGKPGFEVVGFGHGGGRG